MNILSEILSSKIRAEIFRLLFSNPGAELHMREIERRSGFSIGSIQTELEKLYRLDLIIRRRDGNRLYLSANKDHPIFPDIKSIVLKTIGLADVLKSAISNDPMIDIAFVYGSVAVNTEKAGSDVDLMVIGDIGLRKLTKNLFGVAEQISREVNPHVFSKKEFQKRLEKKDHFIVQLMDSPKIFIIGDEREFKKMVG